MKKNSTLTVIFIAFLFFVSFEKSYCQTVYNIYGKAGSYLEDNVFYDFDGTPLMHLSNENVYMFNGAHIGFYVDGIFYNLQGAVVGFRKDAVTMPTEPDPPKAPKAPLPPKAPLEPAHPRPPLLKTFASNNFNQTNTNSQITFPSTSNTLPSNSSGRVTANDITSYQGNAALGGVSSGGVGAIDNSQMNTAISNLAYAMMQYNKFRLELAYKAKPYMDKAWDAYNKKDYLYAFLNVKEALSITGNFNHVGNYLLALIYQERHQYEFAIEYLNIALKYKRNGDYYVTRGFCYFQTYQKSKAKKDFKKAKRRGNKEASEYLRTFDFK